MHVRTEFESLNNRGGVFEPGGGVFELWSVGVEMWAGMGNDVVVTAMGEVTRGTE